MQKKEENIVIISSQPTRIIFFFQRFSFFYARELLQEESERRPAVVNKGNVPTGCDRPIVLKIPMRTVLDNSYETDDLDGIGSDKGTDCTIVRV